jgi:hypothetical protein
MALLDSLLPNAAADAVAIFNNAFSQVFRMARPIKAVVKPSSKLMEHPVETGAVIVDHQIINPIEIELSLLLTSLDYTNTYKTMEGVFKNGQLLSVQTRTGVYNNMIIEEFPSEEDPNMFDIIALAMRLREAQFVTARYGIAPRRPANSTTVQRGEQQATDANAGQTDNGTLLLRGARAVGAAQ